MNHFDNGKIAQDIWDAYDTIQEQVGSPLANQSQLTTAMTRIVRLIER